MKWINFKCVESENSGIGSRKCFTQCDHCKKKYDQASKDEKEIKTVWTM